MTYQMTTMTITGTEFTRMISCIDSSMMTMRSTIQRSSIMRRNTMRLWSLAGTMGTYTYVMETSVSMMAIVAVAAAHR